MENQDKKKELIIDAALKRFAHFGLSKTTMTEIANDLSLSKALLYYYFPDKISLYSAVLGHIIGLMDKELKKGVGNVSSSHEALELFLNKRQEFISKYYNLLDFTKITGSDLPEELATMFRKAKQSEITILTTILNKGIERKELQTFDSEEIAVLLMEALGGIVFSVLKANSRPFFPEKEQFDTILKRQKKLGEIFLNGLKLAS
ncbi:TetR/AcrR family transcriptional regulator [Pararcticibacter amylolyticus]|uniref:TetR/AcrR family transcriptional regulator n=1 Tax=Pararcticibacter amylolyticus TaxID=2173175 RepID=A0A2U2PF56_9SPHI|nr:TetR/AcrR family transcriptional regulator [Pararcticibacter amylolyticus]PWG80037.1 TetR/AcrR family transcriptional regulator [Pararcticibacter amylolyticus]